MRDIIHYPITADEAMSALQVCLESYTKNTKSDGFGSTDGLSYIVVEKFINDNREEFNKFSKQFFKGK